VYVLAYMTQISSSGPSRIVRTLIDDGGLVVHVVSVILFQMQLVDGPFEALRGLPELQVPQSRDLQPEMLDFEVFGLERDLLFDDELRERVEIFRKVTRLRHASNYTRCASSAQHFRAGFYGISVLFLFVTPRAADASFAPVFANQSPRATSPIGPKTKTPLRSSHEAM
jgi:hypothetical protein